MAHDSRDVFVRLGDPFNCPACGSRLSPPPQVVAGHSNALSAAAGCVAFAVATCIGLGMIPLTRTAAASVNLQAVAPPVEVELSSVTLTLATDYTGEQSAQPISYGRPVGPEEEGAAPVRHWHHRAVRHYGFTGFLPGPCDAPDDTQTAEQVEPTQVDSSDSDAAPAT